MISFHDYKQALESGRTDNQDFYSLIYQSGYRTSERRIPTKLNLYPFYSTYKFKHARMIHQGRITGPDPILPPRFALKSSNGYSNRGAFIMRDGIELASGKAYPTFDAIRQAYMRGRGNDPYALAYFVEELIEKDGRQPDELRVYCFGREIVATIQTNVGLKSGGRHTIFDGEWGVIAKDYDFPPLSPAVREEVTREVSRMLWLLDVMFIRVDMLLGDAGPMFGELVRVPSNGTIPHELPDAVAFSKWLGRLWMDAVKERTPDWIKEKTY